MNKLHYFLGLSLVLVLSGCVVRTYPITRDRIDQDLTGNRGYLAGQAPAGEEPKERKSTRTTQVIEVEISSPIKFEKGPKKQVPEITKESATEEKTEDKDVYGNRGYLTESTTPEMAEPAPEVRSEQYQKYTVQKGETLQKISKKLYGTTKKWSKIYNANKDTLKGPNKIYPGQVINVPAEEMKETRENLK